MAGRSKTETPPKEPKVAGRFKQVRVTIAGASLLKADGAAQYVNEGFGLFILDEVFRRQSILSKLKGLLRKKHHCRNCGAGLMGLKARGRRFTLNLSYKELPPLTLDIEMPAIPCRECGTSNAVNEEATEFVVAGAIAKALESLRSTR
jgi:hypothetical protein